jgi:hypothetical protein
VIRKPKKRVKFPFLKNKFTNWLLSPVITYRIEYIHKKTKTVAPNHKDTPKDPAFSGPNLWTQL